MILSWLRLGSGGPCLYVFFFSTHQTKVQGNKNGKTKTKKNVGKGHLFQRVILAGRFEWRGTLAFCDSVVLPHPIGPSCRGTQIILECIVMGILLLFLQPNYENRVGKGCAKIGFSRWCPYSKGNLRWSTRVKGTLRVPPQPGCPRVCPPWAHRSYATVIVCTKPAWLPQV